MSHALQLDSGSHRAFAIARFVHEAPPKTLDELGTSELTTMLQHLCDNPTDLAEEDAAFIVLHRLAHIGRVHQAIDVAGAMFVMRGLSGQYRRLRAFHLRHYYAPAPLNSIVQLLRGSSAEQAPWRQELLADAVECRSDRRELVVALYHGMPRAIAMARSELTGSHLRRYDRVFTKEMVSTPVGA